MTWTQILPFVLGVTVPVVVTVALAVIGGTIYNNKRIDDLRAKMNARFASLETTLNARFAEIHADLREIRTLLQDALRART